MMTLLKRIFNFSYWNGGNAPKVLLKNTLLKFFLPLAITALFTHVVISYYKYYEVKKYSLQFSGNGKFLCSDRVGPPKITVDRPAPAEWEIFIIEDIAGRSYIQDFEKSFFTVDDNTGRLILSENYNQDEYRLFQFEAVDDHNNYTIRYQDKYVEPSDEAGNELITKIESSGHWIILKHHGTFMGTAFTPDEAAWIIIGYTLLFISFMFFFSQQMRMGLLFLLMGAICLRYFIMLQFPYLNLWDEQYHALVAKNMMQDFLFPYLRPDTLSPPLTSWIEGHLWLHKQPLFLWQMAISLKLFGVNEMAARLPSLIMSLGVILLVFRIGTLLVNKRTGFFAALFAALNPHTLKLIVGISATDHNDIAFLFYVTASLWALIEFRHRLKLRYALLAGIFAGCAVLNKWLVGMVVFLPWAVLWLQDFLLKRKPPLKPVIIAFCAAVVVALPWQLYMLYNYNELALFEYAENSRRFVFPFENHTGNSFFHFFGLETLYDLNPYFIIFIFLLLLSRLRKNREALIIVMVATFSVYLIYSLAATKMTSYPFIVAVFIFIALGSALDILMSGIREMSSGKIFVYLSKSLLLLFFCFYLLPWQEIQRLGAKKSESQYAMMRKDRDKMRKFAIHLKEKMANKEIIVINFFRFEHIAFMFYSDIEAISDWNEEIISKLKEKGIKIWFLDRGEVPEIIRNDPQIGIIRPDMDGSPVIVKELISQ